MGRINFKTTVFRKIVADNLQQRRLFIDEAFEIAEQDFIIKRDLLLSDFDNHDVTRELRDEQEAGGNISGTLNGHGNLFSFLGFYQGTDPTQDVRETLEDNTRIIKSSRGAKYSKNGITYSFQVVTAAIGGEIAAASPLPFNTGRSWVLALERGASGLNYYIKHYLFDPERDFGVKSRSGTAIQVKPELISISFVKIQYLSEIINKFILRYK